LSIIGGETENAETARKLPDDNDVLAISIERDDNTATRNITKEINDDSGDFIVFFVTIVVILVSSFLLVATVLLLMEQQSYIFYLRCSLL
jgi:hypothetical protein